MEAQVPSSPVADVGTIVVLLAYLTAAITAVLGIVGNARRDTRLIKASVHGLYGFFGLVLLGSALLVYAFVTHDYTIKYVALTSDTTMTVGYKITAFWGALDGSLLFWVLVLSLFSTAAVAMNARRHKDMIGYVVGTIMVVQLFFLTLLVFDRNPFHTFLTEPPADGEGLNPLLQNYWMVIHPPALYVGFVAATIPFAFAIAALASGRLDDLWLGSVRVWALVCFLFLSLGLILGGRWAYEELGWGGYWAWDPVENAGFLPWFTMTAFLHTAIIQEQRGMLKVWNLVLVILTFFLTIFGTFMTRSGVVQSVHSFGKDDQLALQFVLFMVFVMVISLGLLVHRLPRLRQQGRFESFVSREFAFLLNNWILLACAFFVWFVTMLPTITEHLFGERITIGPKFFNEWMTPLGLALLFLAGAAPLLAWRKTTRERLYAQFLWPGVVAVVVVAGLAIFVPDSRTMTAIFDDEIRLPIPLINFGLAGFTVGSIIQEFVRGVFARQRQTGSDGFTSLVGLVLTKRRKYGGYVVHLGIAVLFIGFAGKAFDSMTDRTIAKPLSALFPVPDNDQERAALSLLIQQKGETGAWRTLYGKLPPEVVFEVRGRTFVYERLEQTSDDNKVATTARVRLFDGSYKKHQSLDFLEVLTPARWQYRKGSEPTSEVSIHEGLDADEYLVLTGYDLDSQLANFRVFINPLVNWVWIGFVMLLIGSLICLIPQFVVDLVSRRPRTTAGKVADVAGLLLLVGSVVAATVSVAHADPPSETRPPTARQIEAATTPDQGAVAPASRDGTRVAQAPTAGVVAGEHEDEVVRAKGHADDAGWAHRYRPDSPLAAQLMKDLVCMCGGCKRETLFECKCGWAAMDRKKVLDMLAAYDLTSEQGRVAARRAVIDAFVREYGGEQVLAAPRSNLTWLLPYLAVLGGLVVLMLIGRGMVRRRSATPVAATGGDDTAAPADGGEAAANPADDPNEDERYADKLDDELRDTD